VRKKAATPGTSSSFVFPSSLWMPTWQTLTQLVVGNKVKEVLNSHLDIIDKKGSILAIDLDHMIKETEIFMGSTLAFVSSTSEQVIPRKSLITPVLKSFSPWTEKPVKTYPKSEKDIPKWDPNPPISTSDYPTNSVNAQSRRLNSLSDSKQHFHGVPPSVIRSHEANSVMISTYHIYH